MKSYDRYGNNKKIKIRSTNPSKFNLIPNFDVICHVASYAETDIIDSYKVGDAIVFITRFGKYLISEPVLNTEASYCVLQYDATVIFINGTHDEK
ncbi:hypothetical protein QVH35_11745 [Candidatus Nitrosotenuis chungbukensis]|uniref:hypothetical protein n=1 Tax=Candidatus Nitrosotenuis chungbukensis TaxID=1353246 RepID=UPI002671BF5C|nr:hypothetical protein [Candidatus Nitrosotenuis chungbukensis]WKT57936.1 hypothetical protein QVH35_11745 [Candidatus Nitrosotenuis chungbukensis]